MMLKWNGKLFSWNEKKILRTTTFTTYTLELNKNENIRMKHMECVAEKLYNQWTKKWKLWFSHLLETGTHLLRKFYTPKWKIKWNAKWA